jgi:hypothetical protein
LLDGFDLLIQVAEVVDMTSAGAEFELEEVVADEADLSATLGADFHGVLLGFVWRETEPVHAKFIAKVLLAYP